MPSLTLANALTLAAEIRTGDVAELVAGIADRAEATAALALADASSVVDSKDAAARAANVARLFRRIAGVGVVVRRMIAEGEPDAAALIAASCALDAHHAAQASAIACHADEARRAGAKTRAADAEARSRAAWAFSGAFGERHRAERVAAA